MDPERSADAPRRRRLLLILGASALALAVALPAYSFGRLSTLAQPPVTTVSAAAGFARDMQVHHNQGVQIALMARDRVDDEAIRTMAYDIAATQAHQSGQMYGWLEVWDLPQFSPNPPMSWMADPTGTHGTGTAHTGEVAMPGLASAEQLAELEAASGDEAERLFLELMIPHHLGAVEMAEAALELTDNPPVRSLADSIVRSQQAELQALRSMLTERT